ncbi:zona pellucida-binding protein 2-like [Numida meleagris]|uniref:zona pellucida-binding protein 2-like n=1 Tax=Numida meleagris TaxID=8996 RepID=UPI000B3DB075|nr:zona pellucida-binding protein 2-like [Numida meleagris]
MQRIPCCHGNWMPRTALPGRMLCAPRFWPDFSVPGLLGTVGILNLVLQSCPGQPAFLPGDPPASSSWEYHGGDVFIHMDSSLYSLPCSTIQMEVANPTYQWLRDRPDPKLLSVTEDGHLLFQHFQAGDSGNYSCTVSYTEHGLPVSQTFHYRVFGYHVLGGLEALLVFHSKLCEDEWTRMFLWDLQERLKQLEVEQHCKIQPQTSACFPSDDKPSDEFVVQVRLEVSLFGTNWDEQCKPQDVEVDANCYRKIVQQSLEQVQLAFTKFFKEHVTFHITGSDISSIIFYTVFVGFLEIKKCSRGYGQTKQLQRCLECCIVCPPGTFSPPANRQCSPCPMGTYSMTYGMAFCTPCEDGMITRGLGASSVTSCMKEKTTKEVDSIIRKIPLILLITVPLLLAINFVILFASCYWFQREYRQSSPTTSKTAGITKTMEKVASFCGIPWQGRKDGPSAAVLNNTSDTDTSQGSEEELMHALSLPETPSSPTVSDDTPAVLQLEDKARNN